MSDSPYDVSVYDRFARDLKRHIGGPNIKRVAHEDLREPAIRTGTQTKYGSWGWRSAVSSRIGGKTCYLGREKGREFKISDVKKSIIGV